MVKQVGRAAMVWLLAVVVTAGAGCASKLVKIDSDPGLAKIYVNDDFVGKTPLYYRFRDHWYPWPVERKDDYTVKARFDSGAYAEEKTFTETSRWPSIGYVPNEIFFTHSASSGHE